jgi:hypothetical protein
VAKIKTTWDTNVQVGNSAEIAQTKQLAKVKAGTHKQFILNTEKERVECRCGHVAIWWQLISANSPLFAKK